MKKKHQKRAICTTDLSKYFFEAAAKENLRAYQRKLKYLRRKSVSFTDKGY